MKISPGVGYWDVCLRTLACCDKKGKAFGELEFRLQQHSLTDIMFAKTLFVYTSLLDIYRDIQLWILHLGIRFWMNEKI
ncbi:hypothetical protein VTL71DRAFT_7782 [Oculimacula yallundae]|uniref:Uncharacterized protein n=1 Tax=Oculimacula yallundae TaxID=86028 RepID=A0ABR4CVN6_9HELO